MSPAAVIMTLPVEATCAEVRALATSVYFAIYYFMMGIGSAVFGVLRHVTENPEVPQYTAAAMLLLCLPLWFAFKNKQKRPL